MGGFLILSFSQSFYLLCPPKIANHLVITAPVLPTDSCKGRYVYVYNLPERFNADILRDCRNIYRWNNMCKSLTNSGLGPNLNNTDGVLQETGWYLTEQDVLEIIFHNRMKQYDCLTSNYSTADVVFIPFYLGLDLIRYLWDKEVLRQDLLVMDLISWVKKRPEWSAKNGRDHFIVSGRPVWDLQRQEDSNWGSKFLTLPESKNMSIIMFESCDWVTNGFAVPYPTYFHPSKKSEVVLWQEKVRSMKRKWLFSFVGGRRPDPALTIRDMVIDQCVEATLCNVYECVFGNNSCHLPSNVMRVLMSSNFCLQPPGDTFTRRSTFDSMLAGCIPVFFKSSSAYSQYKWYFPKNFNKFSVYVPEDALKEGRVNIQDVLLGYSEEQVREMREEVIRMIPRLVYKDPRNKSESFQDAFDIAVDGVIKRIREN
ncbi:hypothetical protein LUZ60_015273 [Juncus effusus]|nr:hypothetical protein LUZ60_015273 [Juncus effusus]